VPVAGFEILMCPSGKGFPLGSISRHNERHASEGDGGSIQSYLSVAYVLRGDTKHEFENWCIWNSWNSMPREVNAVLSCQKVSVVKGREKTTVKNPRFWSCWIGSHGVIMWVWRRYRGTSWWNLRFWRPIDGLSKPSPVLGSVSLASGLDCLILLWRSNEGCGSRDKPKGDHVMQ